MSFWKRLLAWFSLQQTQVAPTKPRVRVKAGSRKLSAEQVAAREMTERKIKWDVEETRAMQAEVDRRRIIHIDLDEDGEPTGRVWRYTKEQEDYINRNG